MAFVARTVDLERGQALQVCVSLQEPPNMHLDHLVGANTEGDRLSVTVHGRDLPSGGKTSLGGDLINTLKRPALVQRL